jgi:hypothetical protein
MDIRSFKQAQLDEHEQRTLFQQQIHSQKKQKKYLERIKLLK